MNLRVLIAACSMAAPPAFAQQQAWAWDDGTVPYVQTPMEIVERMLRMAEVGRDDYVIDLGSGDGPPDGRLEMRAREKPVGVGGVPRVELWIVPAVARGAWTSELPGH